jgi:uncharacterized membrane protein YqjE
MAEPAARHSAVRGDEQSVGDLVSAAVKDVSQLIRYELDLAKIELKGDVKRLGIGGALLGVAAFVGCLMLVLLCFAFAYGLIAVGIWPWAAFLIVAGTCILLSGVAVLIGITKMRRLSGLRKTRRTVQDDLAMIRREDGAAVPPAARAG